MYNGMNLEVYYSEITEFVERKYNKKIVITKAEEGGVKIETKLLEFLPSLSLIINIVDIKKDCIQLSYDGSIGVPLVINRVVKIFNEIIPAGVEVDTENRMIKLYPQQVAQLQKVLEYVSLSDVVFADDGMEVILSLAWVTCK